MGFEYSIAPFLLSRAAAQNAGLLHPGYRAWKLWQGKSCQKYTSSAICDHFWTFFNFKGLVFLSILTVETFKKLEIIWGLQEECFWSIYATFDPI